MEKLNSTSGLLIPLWIIWCLGLIDPWGAFVQVDAGQRYLMYLSVTIGCSDVSFSLDEVGSFIHVLEFLWFSLSADSFFFFLSLQLIQYWFKITGGTHLVFLSWSLIFFSISASVSVSSRGHHWSASPVFLIAISTVGSGFSLQKKNQQTLIQFPLLQRPLPAAAQSVRSLSLNVFQSWGSKTSTGHSLRYTN